MNANGELLEIHARERLGMPDSWRIFNWESLLDDDRRIVGYRLTGAVIPIGRNGTRLGSLNYHHKHEDTVRTAEIRPAEHEAWVADWEARTGLCRSCLGSGEDVQVIYRGTPGECRGCRGTGKRERRSA